MVSIQDLLSGEGSDTKDSSSSSSNNDSTSNSIETFVSSVLINMFISLVLLLAFCILRPRFRRVYAPRTYAVERDKRSEPIGSGLFSWIPVSLRVADTEMVRRAGLDTYMFVRTIRTMFIMFLVISVLSAGTILPVNIQGQGGQVGLNSLSIGNVDPKSAWLWVHVGFFTVSVIWALHVIVGELRIYARIRLWWLTHPDNVRNPGSSTILVSHVPKTLVANKQRLGEIFGCFPGGVRQILISRAASSELASTIKRRDSAVKRLEKVLTAYAVRCTREYRRESAAEYVEPPRPTIRRRYLGVVPGSKADAIEYYTSEITQCNEFIAEANEKHYRNEPAALVTFHEPVAAHMAAQTVLDYKPFSMSQVSVGVNSPDDIIWSNLKMSAWSKRLRGYVSFGITMGITAVWTLVTALLSALVQVKNLAQLKPFAWLLENNKGSAWAVGMFSGFVPSMVLALLMTALPHILRLLLRLEGTARKSVVELRLLHRLYFFQVWNVYLVTIFSSSVLVIAANSINQPEKIIELVQTQVPQSATNILTYVVLLAFIGAAKEILQGTRLAVRYVAPMIAAKTARAMRRAEQPGEFDWGSQIPTHSLVFLMGLSYSFIAPVVAWFAMVYFGLFYVIYRYQFLYVYNDKTWATGGLSFPRAAKQMLVALYVSEVYMVLMMVAKLTGSAGAIMRVVVAAIVLALTVAVHMYINDVYMPIINHLPLKKALDAKRVPPSADFPSVLGSEDDREEEEGNNNNGDIEPGELLSVCEKADLEAATPVSSKRLVKRNRIYAMYSSLVPVCAINVFLWLFPCVLQDKAIYDSMSNRHQFYASSHNNLDKEDDGTENTLASVSSLRSISQTSTATSHLASNQQNQFKAVDNNELAARLSNPMTCAKPVSRLWVPLAGKLFERLVEEVESQGQGAIHLVTQGVWIDDNSLKIQIDLDFDVGIETDGPCSSIS
ncbi:phosphate metabolism protein 7 [Coemansia sp. RSA 2049]|nr:phosphate metabolism protein 7 [Coemansia sp. RSA 2049]